MAIDRRERIRKNEILKKIHLFMEIRVYVEDEATEGRCKKNSKRNLKLDETSLFPIFCAHFGENNCYSTDLKLRL